MTAGSVSGMVKRGSAITRARDDISSWLSVLGCGGLPAGGRCSKTAGLSWHRVGRGIRPGSDHRLGGGQSGNVCFNQGWLAGARNVARLEGFECGSCSTHGISYPNIDPWDESNLQALCRGCHIQKSRLERITPTTQDQRDWATFTKT